VVSILNIDRDSDSSSPAIISFLIKERDIHRDCCSSRFNLAPNAILTGFNSSLALSNYEEIYQQNTLLSFSRLFLYPNSICYLPVLHSNCMNDSISRSRYFYSRHIIAIITQFNSQANGYGTRP
jgi:hypothetical protein